MFKAVSNIALDIKKELDKPHTGTYAGKDEITTKIGPQTIWKFVDEDGLPFGIYGFSNLNRAMNSVREGALCRITYKGTQFVKTKFKPAGQDVHQVLVEIDDGGEEDGESAEVGE
jgi:hypothetical protein